MFFCYDNIIYKAILNHNRITIEEGLTEKELLRKMKQIDKNRSQTREILTNSKWGQRDSYHLIVNTTDWEIKELVNQIISNKYKINDFKTFDISSIISSNFVVSSP